MFSWDNIAHAAPSGGGTIYAPFSPGSAEASAGQQTVSMTAVVAVAIVGFWMLSKKGK